MGFLKSNIVNMVEIKKPKIENTNKTTHFIVFKCVKYYFMCNKSFSRTILIFLSANFVGYHFLNL